jgi:hypothetical protein
MSVYKFSCPHCDQHYAASFQLAHRLLTCSMCQRKFVVPPPPPADARVIHSPPGHTWDTYAAPDDHSTTPPSPPPGLTQ